VSAFRALEIFFRFSRIPSSNRSTSIPVKIIEYGSIISGMVFEIDSPFSSLACIVALYMPHLLFWIVNTLFQILDFPGRIVFSSSSTVSGAPQYGAIVNVGFVEK
jgi:hypothetical protein